MPSFKKGKKPTKSPRYGVPPHPKGACADESNTYHRPWYGTDGNEWLKFVKCYIFTLWGSGYQWPLARQNFADPIHDLSLTYGSQNRLFLCYLFFYLHDCLEACSCRNFRWNTELPKCGIVVTQSLLFCVVSFNCLYFCPLSFDHCIIFLLIKLLFTQIYLHTFLN